MNAKIKLNAYEQIARCAMAVHLQESKVIVGEDAGAKKLEELRGLLRDTLDDCAALFPGGLSEAMEPVEEVLVRDFGWALEQLRSGKRVQRSGWNGKGMWLVFVPADNWGASQLARGAPFENIKTLPWIGMKTADDKFVPWLASQTDVLSMDWHVVE